MIRFKALDTSLTDFGLPNTQLFFTVQQAQMTPTNYAPPHLICHLCHCEHLQNWRLIRVPKDPSRIETKPTQSERSVLVGPTNTTLSIKAINTLSQCYLGQKSLSPELMHAMQKASFLVHPVFIEPPRKLYNLLH